MPLPLVIGLDHAGFELKERLQREPDRTFLETPFAHGRHQGRVRKIDTE